jgi:hypothetical protein
MLFRLLHVRPQDLSSQGPPRQDFSLYQSFLYFSENYYFIILLFMVIALANPLDKKSISLNDIQSGTLVQKGEEPGQYYE